jgi:succinate dehydrogenase/fumarate reductase flavoprotein subunit|tara:strand:+ start:367 stop:780 length:414 start_codon:yes stop_codon:yes gene_type:complete
MSELKVSSDSAVSMPMRNLISIIGAVGIGVWAYFGVIERLNNIETQGKLMLADVEKNTEFRIKWPRGEMGSLPADAQQDMLIEFMASQLESVATEMESMMSNTVNIKRAQQDIEKMIQDIEKLKDKVRQNGNKDGSY